MRLTALQVWRRRALGLTICSNRRTRHPPTRRRRRCHLATLRWRPDSTASRNCVCAAAAAKGAGAPCFVGGASLVRSGVGQWGGRFLGARHYRPMGWPASPPLPFRAGGAPRVASATTPSRRPSRRPSLSRPPGVLREGRPSAAESAVGRPSARVARVAFRPFRRLLRHATPRRSAARRSVGVGSRQSHSLLRRACPLFLPRPADPHATPLAALASHNPLVRRRRRRPRARDSNTPSNTLGLTR